MSIFSNSNKTVDSKNKLLKNSFSNYQNITNNPDNKQGLSDQGRGSVEKCSEITNFNEPQRPILDSSLPYIPVYTHLITYDLVPIERPPTPPVIKLIRSELGMESVPSRSTPESKKSSKLSGNT